MPLLDKLLPSRKSFKNSAATPSAPIFAAPDDDRQCASCVGSTQVRILLFRECEWRGRKLLFDSVTLEKHRCKNESAACNALKVDAKRARDGQHGKPAEDDASLLSEMVFGTVAMTYRGPSFKVHSTNSPPCIMCTKVFPATEHSTCKQGERSSEETLARSVNIESNSSNTSVKALFSRPSSGNLSGNDLTPGPRKSSTCSSNGSGWDIDIPPPLGSSQSLESNGSSAVGSLTSLRRRWLRAVSTSLSRSDSDDAFGIQHWSENGTDVASKRHKTRLGLTMLVRLPRGNERKVETRLLEHMALLEGMLDRLRYLCIEASNANGQGCKRMQLADRMYKASSRIVISLMRVLVNFSNSRTPLLWYDVLLNSVVTVEEKVNTLHRGLQQMCHLLEDIDTKSTNFFLSTIVTGVLTYHLGWVYTVLPSQDRQMMEKLGGCYPCNPLWAQLGDLYGALGNPMKLAHTVIAGDPRKTDLINSILSFLSYFIRSGIVEKRREYRCPSQEDVQEAIGLLEQARTKRPHLFNHARTTNAFAERENTLIRRESRAFPCQKQSQLRPADVRNGAEMQRACSEYPGERSARESPSRPLKRTGTMKSNLDSHMPKPVERRPDGELASKQSSRAFDVEKADSSDDAAEYCASSGVKIIVSEINSREPDATDERDSTRNGERCAKDDDCAKDQLCAQLSLRNFEKKLDAEESRTYDLKSYTSASMLRTPVADDSKNSQVFFTLGDGEKSGKSLPGPRTGHSCQCAYTFTRVPSTSAQLPEGVLRKIIQRNFPESSKSMQTPSGASCVGSRSLGFCLRCNGQGYASSQNFEGTKELLETPTNATEVLRTCGSTVGDRAVGLSRSNSLEALMEANSVVELPMPRSKKVSPEKANSGEETGFAKTLVQNRVTNDDASTFDTGYTWGLVLQGLAKKKKRRKKKVASREGNESNGESRESDDTEKDWWWSVREEVVAGARFPAIDQPVAEAVCILADLDTWHVGILSNNTSAQSSPLPIGMSRLVSNMLESFAYVWRKYQSPSHCVEILEGKLREMWLRSEALAEMLMAAEVGDASVAKLTNALDVDAADIPLLLAVATTHSPEIAQRFGLTLA